MHDSVVYVRQEAIVYNNGFILSNNKNKMALPCCQVPMPPLDVNESPI